VPGAGVALQVPGEPGMMGVVLDVFYAGFAAYPWSTLRDLRNDGGVHRIRTPDGPPAWLVTRYADVRAGLLDERLSTHIRHARGEDYRGFVVPPPLDVSFLNAEPADHARLRRIVTAELSPRRLAEWTSTAPDLVASCLKSIDAGPVEVITSLAVPLPAAVLGELLGLAETERQALLNWATTTLVPSATPPRARDTLGTMLALITAVAQRARTEPTDTVLARLVHGRDEDHVLSADELAGLLFYLLFVWYEVLVDLVAGSMAALLPRPDQAELLRAGHVPADAAVDELLRYLSPQVLAGPRFAITDLEIGAHTIPAGETVLLCLAAANHDPACFIDPETVDLARAHNPHLGLGYGGHSCLGTALVRTITGTLMQQLLTRWPDSRLAVPESEIAWRSGFRHRGPLALPVVLR